MTNSFCYSYIDLKNNKFSATDVEVNIHKMCLVILQTIPELLVSAKGDSNKTLLNKGIFYQL